MKATTTYTHHGKIVSVRPELLGKHRDYCLCHQCSKLNLTDRNQSCPIANLLYAVNCQAVITTPVFECANYLPAPAKEENLSTKPQGGR